MPFSSVSTVDFEQVNVSWAAFFTIQMAADVRKIMFKITIFNKFASNV